MGANTLLAGKTVVFFDTHCVLCSHTVQFLLKRDRSNLYYTSLQGKLARKLLPDDLRGEINTVVLYHDGKISVKSRAIFQICRYLRYPWPLLRILAVLPEKLTDYFYDWVARNRFSWFGRRETCFVPSTEQRGRFFD